MQRNESSSIARLLRRREAGVLALVALTVLVVAWYRPDSLAGDNVRNMLERCAPGVIVACGLTLVIVTGEIDISVGSLMGLLAAVVGICTSTQRMGMPVAAGVAITLAAGAGVGLVNGLLVTVGRVPSIIVTLGMLTALRGVTELAMGGKWIEALPADLRFFGTGAAAGVPVSVWTAVIVVAATAYLTYQTALGRRIYAVGSSPRAARMAGLSERRIKVFVFTLTGLLVAVATLVSATQLDKIEQGVGKGFELFAVTAVVVGGTAISGGRGTIWGSILGVALLVIVRPALVFLPLGQDTTYWERAIQGGLILVAVLADHFARRRSGRGEGA
jgi:ribose/xylose/arabinose/galactoside ABC-type transport system permease subunit